MSHHLDIIRCQPGGTPDLSGMLHDADDADAVVQGLICNLLITLVIENNNYNVL